MKMTLAIFAFALAATMAMPASAHMPSDCYGLAVERRATQGALIDALESLATFVHARAPMPVIDQALTAAAGVLADFGDADLRFVECLVDAD